MRSAVASLTNVVQRLHAALSRPGKAHRAPMQWLRRPTISVGDRVCIFVLLLRNGNLLQHSADLLAAWRIAGYKIVIIAVTDSMATPFVMPDLGAEDGFAIRANRGYDFGAWAAAIRTLRRPLRDASILALANDSVLGPSTAFPGMLERAAQTAADVIGLTESRQVRQHLQSFLLFFKPKALRSRVFARFWSGVRIGGRQYVIDRYETRLLARFTAAGLRAERLFPMVGGVADNPTLARPQALLDAGFPFLKIQLLRDNPAGVRLDDWRECASAAGFDLAMLDRQIASLQAHGSTSWQV